MSAVPFPIPLSRDLGTGSRLHCPSQNAAAAQCKLAGAERGLELRAVGPGPQVISGAEGGAQRPAPAGCGWLWPAAATASWTRSMRLWRWPSGGVRGPWTFFFAVATSRRCATRPTCAAWLCRPSTATCKLSTGEGRGLGLGPGGAEHRSLRGKPGGRSQQV